MSVNRSSLVSVAATLAAAATTTTLARDAVASGFLVTRFGGEHGHPTTDEPAAIYYNPAGLALGAGHRVHVEGLLAVRGVTYDRPEGAIDAVLTSGQTGSGTPEDAIAANSGRATLSNVAAAPFLGIASDLGVENLGVGFGLYAPFGGGASWDRNAAYADNQRYPGAVDGVQRWSTIEGSLRSLYLSGGGAYRIPSARLSIGAAVNVVRSEISLVRARTASGTDDLVYDDEVLEGRSLLNAEGTTASVALGVIWQPAPELWVGLSYQSQPGLGTMELSGTLKNKFGTSDVTTTSVVLQQELPDVVRAGLRYRPEQRIELRVFGDYARWSVFDKQCVLAADDPKRNCTVDESGAAMPDASGIVLNLPRRWQDAFGVRGGISYWIGSERELELLAGAGYDGNAVPDETLDPSLPDMHKVAAAVGGRYAFSQGRYLLAAQYLQVFYFDRTTEPRAMDPSAPSRSPDPAGTYSQSVGALIVSVAAKY